MGSTVTSSRSGAGECLFGRCKDGFSLSLGDHAGCITPQAIFFYGQYFCTFLHPEMLKVNFDIIKFVIEEIVVEKSNCFR